MLVGDINITDLFDAIGAALALPPVATPDEEAARASLLGRRIAAVCAAVDHVRTTGDPVEAIGILDAAVEEHPADYALRPPRPRSAP
ncbi:hypothetical protein ACOQFV_17525 [Nocardiopsis changdeensis]|uniref:Tetratricopeptide repeat protein n=1 Tax=Nocardiopsis changdeensis TaxID=2831969 RepID=A0ABX8BP03_9ACTN|nr:MULTISPECIES: hypothetical protein [Nocardiopsis]QUX23970.1 hypothetical protein KGD84_06475 [Nocardiopsis changdeensis]QYX39915.1 hypothetical protein K1J57_15930 [Nocardiopsis sp. MT53]